MRSLDHVSSVALDTALKAGKFLLDNLGEIRDIKKKSSSVDLVTDIDLSAQSLIVKKIREDFPADSILAEEGEGTEGGDRRWIVDPLDGTTNYVHGFPLFSVSIAYEEEGELQVGVIECPYLEETFTACRGEGAKVNDRKIKVSSTTNLQDCLLATGFPYKENRMSEALSYFNRMSRRARGVRRCGSAAIDLAYLAMGRLDAFWEGGLQPWDLAAGTLILQEAGGRVSDLEGDCYDIHSSDYVVASNGNVHTELLEALNG